MVRSLACLALVWAAMVSATPMVNATPMSATRRLLPDAEAHFKQFITDFNRQYADDEETDRRFQIFRRNLEQIDAQNAGSDHAVFGIDNFTDQTWEEIQMGCILKTNDTGNVCENVRDQDIVVNEGPEEWDWSKQNIVTEIRQQGACGSCWAFSAAGNLEGQYALKNKKLLKFSEQQLVDCDKMDQGCDGGFMNTAFKYWEAEGAMLEKDYPYKGREGTCAFDKAKVVVKVKNCKQYFTASEEKLKDILHSVGPLSVAVCGSSLMGYKGGIMNNCMRNPINHGVLLVGYGTENGKPYWILKNSWGKSWGGEQGYFRLERGTNQCGIMNHDGMIASSFV